MSGDLGGARIAIVEDHALLAHSVGLALRAEGADVLEVPLSNLTRVLAECLAAHPHVVLVDLDLGPELGDGTGLIAPLALRGSRVVVVTGSTDDAKLGDCLRAGATGLVSKAEPLERLVEVVRLAHRGERAVAPGHAARLFAARRAARRHRDEVMAPFESLTAAERQVLAALQRGRQVDDIAREHVVSPTTVRSQVRSILIKLGVRSQLAAVARAHEAGWTLPEAADAGESAASGDG